MTMTALRARFSSANSPLTSIHRHHYNIYGYLATRYYGTPATAHQQKRFKILFFGRDEFSCKVLEELHAAKDVWEQIALVTNPDEKVGRRGSQLSVSPLKLLGQSLKLPVTEIPHTRKEFRTWQPPSPFQITELENVPQSHVIVTASFGRILPNALLDMFGPTRRLNVHPSLLPLYRGPAPIQHAIANGEKETGVCVIEMLKKKEGIDAGSIYGCSRVPIHEGAMFVELRDTLAHVGGRLLVSTLRKMRIGQATATPQTSAEGLSHATTISNEYAAVDFATMTADQIVRRHRAVYHQRPLITWSANDKTVQLHMPEVLTEEPPNLSSIPGTAIYQKATRTVVIRCADGSVLSVPLMKQQDKTLMEALDWWNGAKGLGLVKDGELKFKFLEEQVGH